MPLVPARQCLVLLAAGMLLVAGCSKEMEAKLAKAQAELAEAEVELAEARAQTEAANLEVVRLKAELKRLTAPADPASQTTN